MNAGSSAGVPNRIVCGNSAARSLGLAACRKSSVLQHHPASDAYANDIEPALREIEQMRVEQRTDYVLDHNDKSDPLGQTVATEQQHMGDPHRPEDRGTDEAQLYRDRESLIVRIGSGNTSGAGFSCCRLFK
jgi:hypothetical protein